ncbi:hypothetical protein L873DRAFT_1264470 [Choiromyces venosus 120613-1]|uniref:Nephrocystin 3-like N-terminal domain-containing protein n=1 Tax=Choiromyces venosus 120613-1 TaxID=1336337 RepID=A0A3N4JHD5_9PEZI|nr:hypothetical protein L873DRAFT_1264470 [Choiromyces venosus 120613-1]
MHRYFLGVEMIGQWLSHKRPHHPLFFSPAHTATGRVLIILLQFSTNRGTISTFSQYSGEKIMAEASYTRSVNMGDNNSNCNNTVGSFNNVGRGCTDYGWISPLEPQNRHQSVRTDRFDGVGDWLLETKEFRDWRTRRGNGGSDEAVLFCFGNPGVGKTYLRYVEREPFTEAYLTNDLEY